MKSFALLLVLLAAAAFTPVASAHSVGTSSVIDGVEVWKDGPPPRPYRVMAKLQRQGADGSATYRDEEKSIVAEAKQQGADAVIVDDAVMEVVRMSVIDGRPVLAPKVQAELIKYQ